MIGQYKGLWRGLADYYVGYGGLRTFLASPLLHLSLGVTVLGYFYGIGFDWRFEADQNFPTILGFSLAAYTFIFSLMGSELRSALNEMKVEGGKRTYLRAINGTFFHAIFLQLITYLYCLVSKGGAIYYNIDGQTIAWIIDGTQVAKHLQLITDISGTFLVIYSALLMVAVLLAIFRLANAAELFVDPPTPVDDNDGTH